jgi:hypothetical protein
VLYVEQLIAPDVINTMPEATLRAFADHGRIARTLDADPDEAQTTLDAARPAGVDLDRITAELTDEGVQAFCASYRQLLDRNQPKLPSLGRGTLAIRAPQALTAAPSSVGPRDGRMVVPWASRPDRTRLVWTDSTTARAWARCFAAPGAARSARWP